MGKPCQQAICGIHRNELPQGHIFKDVDGITSGPSSFSGSIEKEIKQDLTKLSLVQFDPVAGRVKEIPEDIVKELSTDQKYLYEIALVVQNGPEHCPENLLTKEPGALNNARWNTLANRILRLYITKRIPSPNLKRLVHFILNEYAPGWFQFKRYSTLNDGSKNIFYFVQLSEELPEPDRTINEKVKRPFFMYESEMKMLHSVKRRFFAFLTLWHSSTIGACIE